NPRFTPGSAGAITPPIPGSFTPPRDRGCPTNATPLRQVDPPPVVARFVWTQMTVIEALWPNWQ
ncbi:hypothetical protein, partial [Burkholderia cepacia]|uniref:hypothetical protein n=1 Tax=Burkholderia cepacia TaxID=292 RepID=UPI001C7187B2